MKFLFRIQTNECFKEFIGKDIIILIEPTYWSSFAIFSKIGIAQATQMKRRRDLDSSAFIKSSHIIKTSWHKWINNTHGNII